MAMVQALTSPAAPAVAAATSLVPPGDKCTQSAAADDPAGKQLSTADQQLEDEEQPVVDIVINNVVAAFCVRCHLDLKYIAMNGDNVEYRRENGMVTMKLRNPYTTASLWSSGKITCTGTTSERDARIGARRVARYLQTRLKYRVKFANYRVVNVLGTCNLPFAIKIMDFSQKYPKSACYEPELHPGVTFRIESLRATLKVFSTGSMTITAASVEKVSAAVEHVFPLVYEFRKEKSAQDLQKTERLLSRRFSAPHAAEAVGSPSMSTGRAGEQSDSELSEGAVDQDDDDDGDGDYATNSGPSTKRLKIAHC